MLVAEKAIIDPKLAGKPVLAFIHIETRGFCTSKEFVDLYELPEMEEVHTVAGKTSLIVKARLCDSNALEYLLMAIHAVPEILYTNTFLVLTTHLARPTQIGITQEWPVTEL